jgi:transcriptional regulator with XRE-family HTH domain
VNAYYKYVGGVLKQKREVNKLSQRQVGEAIGAHQSAVARIEYGQRELSLLEAFKAVDLMRFDIMELYPVDGKKSDG